jgi:RNA polymerase sigma-70 factor (ECF subfamily)
VIEEARAACAALAEHGITISAEDFARELARRAEAVKSDGPLHVFELALAWACAQRSEAAIRYFEQTYFPQASRALRKMKLSRTLAEDIFGWMQFELFVRPEGALIATYSGRGDLGSWVRAIAVHEALKRARRARREVNADLVPELPVPEPELVAMRGAYGAEFTRALSESFRSLTAQERTLLRQTSSMA